MKRLLVLATIVTIPLAANAATRAPAAKTGTVSITLPGDLNYDFKKGPGQQAAQRYCLTCHSSAYVSMQAPMDSARWTAEVNKMRKVYGLEMPDADVAVVADYLGKEYGSPSP